MLVHDASTENFLPARLSYEREVEEKRKKKKKKQSRGRKKIKVSWIKRTWD